MPTWSTLSHIHAWEHCDSCRKPFREGFLTFAPDQSGLLEQVLACSPKCKLDLSAEIELVLAVA